MHRKLGAYEAAARDYNEALQRGECNVRAYTNFAFCLAKLGYYVEAVRAYDSVLELDPANKNALHNRCCSAAEFYTFLVCLGIRLGANFTCSGV